MNKKLSIVLIILLVLAIAAAIFFGIRFKQDNTTLSTVRDELDSAKLEIEGLNENVTALEGDKTASEAKIAELEGSVTSLTEELGTATEKLEKSEAENLGAKLEEAQAEVATLTEQVGTLTEQVTALTDENTKLATKTEAQKKQLQTVAAEGLSLFNKNTEINAQVKELTEQVTTLTAEKDELAAQAESFADQSAAVAELQTQVEDLTAKNDELTAFVNDGVRFESDELKLSVELPMDARMAPFNGELYVASADGKSLAVLTAITEDGEQCAIDDYDATVLAEKLRANLLGDDAEEEIHRMASHEGCYFTFTADDVEHTVYVLAGESIYYCAEVVGEGADELAVTLFDSITTR